MVRTSPGTGYFSAHRVIFLPVHTVHTKLSNVGTVGLNNVTFVLHVQLELPDPGVKCLLPPLYSKYCTDQAKFGKFASCSTFCTVLTYNLWAKNFCNLLYVVHQFE
jgi:hypothetical protein